MPPKWLQKRFLFRSNFGRFRKKVEVTRSTSAEGAGGVFSRPSIKSQHRRGVRKASIKSGGVFARPSIKSRTSIKSPQNGKPVLVDRGRPVFRSTGPKHLLTGRPRVFQKWSADRLPVDSADLPGRPTAGRPAGRLTSWVAGWPGRTTGRPAGRDFHGTSRHKPG